MSPARATLADSVRVGLSVVAPMVAQGVIRRRPRIVRLVQRLDLERRSNETIERLRAKYGDGPLVMSVRGRTFALVMAPADVERLLAESPEPYALDTREKHAALSHFQPNGVLISRGPRRERRRAFNEQVLLHFPAEPIAVKAREEVSRLRWPGVLDWPEFGTAFSRIIRRVALGDAAADDEKLTAELNELRDRANWAYLRPHDEGLRRRFQARVEAYVDKAEPGSLAKLVAQVPAAPDVDPAGQLPHWLFAFDAAAMTAYRTLAVLASQPEHQTTDVNYLMACVQETLRLWPTTLTILRQSTEPTAWGATTLPPETSFMIVSGYFHRRAGHTFAPERWLDGSARRSSSIVPFSGGAGECPGRNLVLFLTATVLAEVLRGHEVTAVEPLTGALPATLDHESVRVQVHLRKEARR